MMSAISNRTQLLLGATLTAIGMVMMPAIATAPSPPQLVFGKLNGRSTHILYLTRSKDRVLVRCYPGLQPRIVVRQQAAGTKEGILTCGK
ncbi:hypothetical protein [Chamaesiphon sp.]|uniref:hypothetical protein n=1 Tax=Chamaesiphon sp. TaxID=2814140 RepID=UPI0035937375